MKKQRKSGLLIFALTAAFLISVGYTFYVQGQDLEKLNRRISEAEASIEQRNAKIKKLHREISDVGTAHFVEKYARENLDMIEKGDIVYMDINKQGDAEN